MKPLSKQRQAESQQYGSGTDHIRSRQLERIIATRPPVGLRAPWLRAASEFVDRKGGQGSVAIVCVSNYGQDDATADSIMLVVSGSNSML